MKTVGYPGFRVSRKIGATRCMKMSVAMTVVLILLGLVSLAAMIGTVVLVIRDGRGKTPVEPSVRPWTAGNLPSRPYSTIRL
jgi:hypothetical protein